MIVNQDGGNNEEKNEYHDLDEFERPKTASKFFDPDDFLKTKTFVKK